MTAIHSGTLRYFWQISRGITRSHWKAAVVWYFVLAIGGFFVLNWIYQAIRKPGEIFAPISASFSKNPESTWQSYGATFERHSTTIISAEFLAALAQVEANGNPIARTYWRWQWSWNPFEVYRPASSAVGMFQMTDGTFAEARKYCIRDQTVVSDGPWYDLGSCWFNSFYTRTIPSHSAEMTAAYLHRNVSALAARRAGNIGLAQQQQLAAVIHLCGRRRGESFVTRRFQVAPGERCGTHSLKRYLTRLELLKKEFHRIREANQLGSGTDVL
jgi:Transglycosylase SLT domain